MYKKINKLCFLSHRWKIRSNHWISSHTTWDKNDGTHSVLETTRVTEEEVIDSRVGQGDEVGLEGAVKFPKTGKEIGNMYKGRHGPGSIRALIHPINIYLAP